MYMWTGFDYTSTLVSVRDFPIRIGVLYAFILYNNILKYTRFSIFFFLQGPYVRTPYCCSVLYIFVDDSSFHRLTLSAELTHQCPDRRSQLEECGSIEKILLCPALVPVFTYAAHN